MEILKVLIQRNLTVLAIVTCSCASSQSADRPNDRIEIRGFGGGVNTGNLLLNQPAFSAGVEGAVRLNRIVAVTGDYAFDHLGSIDNSFCFSSSCSQSHQSQNMHEFMGGFRFSIPNRSRITPYAGISAGGVALTDRFSFSGGGVSSSGSSSSTKFAFGLGAGANYRISRRTGINVDARGVAVSFGFDSTPGWIVRTTGGFYFRF
jgi:opacity protein-like surface antigen